MAQPATNPKIEELRARLKADPRSRLFYPLAEELRKAGQSGEAEQVLRTGLGNHPTYLSAWVSLGRVLRELHKDADAVEALNKALQLDPGNVVAARLIADAYLTLGEKVEAIKKYKLVSALLPGDEAIAATIERLDAEIRGPIEIPEPAEEESPFAPEATQEEPAAVQPPTPSAPAPEPAPFEPPLFDTAAPAASPEASPWDEGADGQIFHDATLSMRRDRKRDVATGDAEPMRAQHAESPFEEPAVEEGYGTDAFSIEQPAGMHVARAPMAADLAVPLPEEPLAAGSELPAGPVGADEADVFEPSEAIAPGIVTEPFAVTGALPPVETDDFARTLTMADLYASQGLVDEARDIYEDILARDPGNSAVRAKMEGLAGALPAPMEPEVEPELETEIESEPAAGALTSPPAAAAAASAAAGTANPKVEKLRAWLARVKRGEGGRV